MKRDRTITLSWEESDLLKIFEKCVSAEMRAGDSLDQRAKVIRKLGFFGVRSLRTEKILKVLESYERLDEDFKPTHLHKKGRHYQVIGEGIIEETGTPAVIYKNDAGMTWIRPAEEFYDGRFTPIEEIGSDNI